MSDDQPTADEQRIQALTNQASRLRAEAAYATTQANEIDAQVKALEQQARPTYPTEAHRAGIIEAARRVREMIPWKSHHGDPCGPEARPYAVCATPGRPGFRQVEGSLVVVKSDGSPFRPTWMFGQSDVDAFIDLLEDERLRVVEHWPNSEGHSFIVRVPDCACA